jgi:hypothetical protein
MRRWGPLQTVMFAIAGLFPPPVVAQGVCQLCAVDPAPAAKPARPLKMDIETTLDFSTAAHTRIGSGTVTVDPRTGSRSFMGLVGFGGPALRGTVIITGEPLRRVRVEMPAVVSLNSTRGAKAEITDIRSDLSPDPMIGLDGRLAFSFGGKLNVRDGAAGDFHGRVQIRAEYQ